MPDLMRGPILSLCVLLAGCGDDTRRAAEIADAADGEIADEEVADTGADSDAPAPLELGDPVPAGRVVAGVATRPDQLVSGPKAEGELGDLVLENHRARFVVEGARRAGGYRMWGGNLVDVAVDGEPDRFGELWFAWNLAVFEPTAAVVVADGADGHAAVRVSGRTGAYAWPDSFMRALLQPPPIDLAITYDYTLVPDEARLALTVTLTNDGAAPADLSHPFTAMNMGDGAKSFAPDSGFGGVNGGIALPWIAAVGPEASYALITDDDAALDGVFSYANMDILRLPPATLAPGESLALGFTFAASSDGTPGLVPTPGGATLTLAGTVGGNEPSRYGKAWVAITAGARVGALAIVDDEGRFSATVPTLPGGGWTVTAYADGVGASAPVIAAASRDDLALELPAPATLAVTIRDADSGQPIPAALTLFRDGAVDTDAPDAVRIDRDWGGGRAEVVLATAPGTFARVPAGRYRAVASRGYSYELTEVTLDLASGEAREVDLTIARAVDTTGWSAGDFHLHAQWSSDSDVPYDTRVRQAAAGDVALPVLTEHAYVGDLLSAAEIAGVADWVAAIPAQEVTTFEYGHFNAFPLVYDPDLPSGGAVFEHGRVGGELFEAMRAQQPDDVLIQVNHPRYPSLIFSYFEYVQLDATTGVAANPERFSANWDLIEVFNGRCLGSAANAEALRDWIALTNLGWRKTLSSGSDSHSEAAGVGHPRNWVHIDRAAVALDPQAIVAPLRAREAFVSCGPFVRFAGSDGTPMGGLAALDGDGAASFAVSVEAPTWMAIDEIRLLENGVVIQTITPDDPRRGPDVGRPALRFDGALTARPGRDAWYAIEVVGSGSLSPVELDDSPYALTNPIEVDGDGDGAWTPPGATTPR